MTEHRHEDGHNAQLLSPNERGFSAVRGSYAPGGRPEISVPDDRRSEAVSRVSSSVQKIWYRGDDPRMVPLQIDESRAEELNEAWVPVLTPDGPGYLAWINSD